MEKDGKMKHCICFLVDHVTPKKFFDIIDTDNAPNVSKYILGQKKEDGTYSKATISRNMVTGYPSTSANSHVTLMTGSYQGKTQLLYHDWWDLTGKKPKYVDTGAISFSLLKKYNKEFMSSNVKTIFDYFPTSASFHAINRGADFKLLNTKSLIFNFLPLLMKMKSSGDPNKPSPIADPNLWRNLFGKYIGKFIKRTKIQGLPQISYIVFLLTDENGHHFGFNSLQYREAIQILDFFVESIVEGMTDRKGRHLEGLKELGYMDKLNWCICTDHAARKVYRDKLVLFNTMLERETGLRLVQGKEETEDNVMKKKFKHKYEKINAFSTVGGEIWHGWFSGGKGDTLSDFRKFWGETHFRSLLPKKPIITLEDQQKDAPFDFVDYLLDQESVHHIIIPEEDVSINQISQNDTKERAKKLIKRDYSIKIISKIGTGHVKRTSKLDKGIEEIYYSYTVLEGSDPLEYDCDKIDGLEYGKDISNQTWLEKTIHIEFPDTFQRIFGFLDDIKAPNIIVTSSEKYHYINVYDVSKHKQKTMMNVQTHDGLFANESIVPATFSGPCFSEGTTIPYGRNVDVLPTILNAMDIPYSPDDMDGIPLKDALK